MNDRDEFPEATEREVALALFVADTLLSDFEDIGEALKWAQRVFEPVDTEPLWAHGRHDGDCTSQPMTCSRCLVESYEEKARSLAVAEGFLPWRAALASTEPAAAEGAKGPTRRERPPQSEPIGHGPEEPEGTGRLQASGPDAPSAAAGTATTPEPGCDQKGCDNPGTYPLQTNYGFLGRLCAEHYDALSSRLGAGRDE